MSAPPVFTESPSDAEQIRRLNLSAFGRRAEADLVDALRRQGQLIISLVAKVGKDLVGSAALSPVTLMPTVPGLRMLGLGPVAVLPAFQRRGYGSILIQEAIRLAQADGWLVIVALGRPAFYSRFGFAPANHFGLGCEFDAASSAFMALELRPGTLLGLGGVVRYQPEFLLA